jgi:deferrochelatase/peroxidase EfeB
MAPNISSKSLKASTELTVIANIKQGLVQIPDPMSYTTRLERLLDVLFQQRKKSVETGAAGFVGPLELLRSLHFVHWSIIDSGTRLLLTVAYDKPWEPYIRSIVDDAGPILDVIFFHCEGYEQSTTRHGYPAFAKWVRERQQTTNFFFADFPELSVDDIRHLQKLRSLHDDKKEDSSTEALSLEARVGSLKPKGDPAALLKTVLGLYRLKSYYPSSYVDRSEDPNSDRSIFNRAVRLIVQGYSRVPLENLEREREPDEIKEAYEQIKRAYDDFGPWYESILRDVPEKYQPPETNPPVEWIQGNIIRGYQRMNHGCMALLRLPNEIHRRTEALLYLAERMTTQAKDDSARVDGNLSPEVKRNFSLTFNGMKAAGLSSLELDALPTEFREGMEARAGALGDVGEYHPEKWQLPTRNWPKETGARIALSAVDAVAVFQTWGDDKHLGPELLPVIADEVRALEAAGFQILHVQPLRRYEERFAPNTNHYKEHFGHLDGLSEVQPVPRPKFEEKYNNEVSYGEVLVGHPNDHGDASPYARNNLLLNGSFFVVRKLAQDVPQFQAVVEQACEKTGKSADEVKALLMGRRPDGTPLVADPPPDKSSFTYDGDEAGLHCPFQSHARLANPRTKATTSVHGKPRRVPRLTRRGFSYGSPYQVGREREPRGLLFMAYVASIAEQYEIVQRWLNGGNSTGLPTTQNDPITAPAHVGRAPFRFKEPANESGETKVSKLDPIVTPIVTLEWGLYLFSPSLLGMRYLAQAAAAPADVGAGLIAGGEKLLGLLLKADDPLGWKKILEGQGEREKAWAVWAAIRARGGVLKTSYGILVGSEEAALQVLKDESRFSAREYWLRMKASGLPMHLGMDKKPVPRAVGTQGCPVHQAADREYVDDVATGIIDYDKESVANQLVSTITLSDAFNAGYAVTHELLARSAEAPDSKRRLADIFLVGEVAVAQLSRQWFGLPDGQSMKLGGSPIPGERVARCPADFTYAAQLIFRPNPDAATKELSIDRGTAIQASAQTFVAAQAGAAKKHPFYVALRDAVVSKFGVEPPDLQQRVARALVGAIDGFVAANFGSFVSTISFWIKTQDFWQVQIECESDIAQLKALAAAAAAAQDPAKRGSLEKKLWQALRSSPLARRVHYALGLLPVPAWLHRTALKETILGGVKVMPGDRVALHLGSIALDKKNPEMLFGGTYDPASKGPGDGQTPQHACPARPMGLGVMLGMIAAVLELKSVRADSPLAISFDAGLA